MAPSSKKLGLPEILTLAGSIWTGEPTFAGASAKIPKLPKYNKEEWTPQSASGVSVATT